MDQHLLSFVIRFIHVVSMSVLLGGTILLPILARNGDKEQNRGTAALALKYEWVFWLAIGVQVITGIGNLGAFGAGLPGPTTLWGIKLVGKLALVTLFLPISLVRVAVTTRLQASAEGISPGRTNRSIGAMYAFSAMVLTAIVLLAEALAHG